MENKSKKRKSKPVLVASHWTGQLDAFVDVMKAFGGRSDLSDDEWWHCYGLFVGLRRLTPQTNWQGLWKLVKQRKRGTLRLPKNDLEVLDAFALFNRVRDERWNVQAVQAGYWKDKERAKKAKDPEGYKAAAIERAKKSRDRKREEKLNAFHAQLLAESLEIDADIDAIRRELAATQPAVEAK